MKLIVFLLVYPILWLVSILPFRVLYFLSDCIYILIYRIFKYRKRVVRQNIALSFPNLSEKERHEIEKKFFHHMIDLFLEMIKTMTISDKDINERFVYKNLELYQEFEKKEKSIIIMISHYASYEWAISMNRKTDFESYAIYKKINNPYFDKLVRDIRSRFKATLITTKATKQTIEDNFNNKKLSLYGFASDQNPKLHTTHYWQKFMGIEVPIQTGAEMLAKKYDMNILFLKTKKVKRGYYEASFEILSENSAQYPDYQITDKFIQKVEQQILEAPEFYLWTHKRWKHKR